MTGLQTAEVIELTKLCSACKESKSLSEFYPTKGGPFGRAWRCKACMAECSRERRKRVPKKSRAKPEAVAKKAAAAALLLIGRRLCPSCKVEKDIGEFSLSTSVPNGRNYRCRDCANNSTRAWRDAGDNRRKINERSKRTNKERAYGLSPDAISALLNSQGGGCAICRKTLAAGTRLCHVDHDHSTRINRGILCHHCNTALGLFFDDEVRLQSAIDYLRRSRLVSQ